MRLRLVRLGMLAAILAAAPAAAAGARTGADIRRATVGAPQFGIASEEPKWDGDHGSSFYSRLTELGMTTSRLAITWDPARPLDIHEKALFDILLPKAAARGIDVSLVITASHPTVFSKPANRALLPAFLQLLARSYPQVRTYVIGNEPNDSHFWRPQFGPGASPVSPAAFVDLLARSYDALKAVDPTLRVSAGGLVAHGNDNPNAPSHISISPVRFLHYMGHAFRASGRSAPIMDELSFHPYPRSARDALLKSYAWPNAGIADLDRIKQAFWDAFHDTAQRTFGEGLGFNLDETGWQVSVAAPHAGAYSGRELSQVADEASQAAIYSNMIRHLACDASVRSVLIYRLTDDARLEQWQSGLLRADRSQRVAYDAVRQTIAQTAGRCRGQLRSFRHTTGVMGAVAAFPAPQGNSRGIALTAEENALATARILRVPSPTAPRRALLAAAVQQATTVATVTERIRARWKPVVRFPRKRLSPGWYVYSVKLAAELNPARTTTLTSRAFRVG